MSTLAATFASAAEAATARAALVHSGVPAERLALSASLTADGIAAEAPGQSYENQKYRGSDEVPGGSGRTDTDRARYNEKVRAAGCLLTVQLDAGTRRDAVEELLRRHGARSIEEGAP